MNNAKLLFLIILSAYITKPLANNKLSKELANELTKTTGDIELYILLKNKNSLKKSIASNRITRLKNTIAQLKSNALYSQKHLEKNIAAITQQYKFYWVNNSLWAIMPRDKVMTFANSPDVVKVYINSSQKLKVVKDHIQQPIKAINGIEWNLTQVNIPQVWQMGFKGQNVIIAGQDTGYQWDHISLKEKYAGWNGSTVNHNYRWHDSINNPITVCQDGLNNPAPCDDHGHGTHTMGTMLGDDGLGNQIGVAPDAKWIGCRNMNQGDGTPATYTECFQFFLEPTDLNNSNPDVTKAPHIINNSWGCPTSEGCLQPNVLETVVNNVVAAGILVVAAAGNDGSACNSINTPIAIYDKTLTVGSTTSSDNISSFSSRGAITIDGSNRLKPDVSAPGSSIRSAQLNGTYTNLSGTSMASPHVAGVAALLISANPALAGHPEQLKQIILESSLAKTSTQSCNGVSGSQSPNNTFGWGRLDALAAVNLARQSLIFDNGFENN